MTNKGFALFTLVATLAVTGTARADEDLLHALAQRDAQWAAGLSATFTTRALSHMQDTAQGDAVSIVRLTHRGDATAVLAATNHMTPPMWRSPTSIGYQAVDFDRVGNLVLWRNVKKTGVSGAASGTARILSQMSVIDAGDVVVERDTHEHEHRYPGGSMDAVYEFEHFQLALGRGFSQFIQFIHEVTESSDGRLQVVAPGNYGPTLWGVWHLEVEPAADFLVRKARFVAVGEKEAEVLVSTEGLHQSQGLIVAEKGHVGWLIDDMNTHNVSVELQSIRPVYDPLLMREAMDVLAQPLPQPADNGCQ